MPEKSCRECERLSIALEATREYNRKLTEELRAAKGALGEPAPPAPPPVTDSALKAELQLLKNAHERLRERKNELRDKVDALILKTYQQEEELRTLRARKPPPVTSAPTVDGGPRERFAPRAPIRRGFYEGEKPLRTQYPIEEVP
jgi:hypothetical protein